MLHQITISLHQPMMMAALPRTYTKGNIMKVLSEDWTVHNMDSNKYISALNSKDPNSYPIPYTTDLQFNKRIGKVSHHFEFNTTIDDSGNEVGITDEDKAIKKAFENFWLQHPLCLLHGKPIKGVTKNPLFNITDSARQAVEELVDFDQRLMIANRVNEMDLAELQDVCYFFGEAPGARTMGEIKVLLAGANGILFVRPVQSNMESNASRFVKTWLKEEDPQRDMLVTVNKAIKLGIIANNPQNNLPMYYLGDTLLGASVEEVLAFCLKEQRLYEEYVVKGVKAQTDNKQVQTDSDRLAKHVSRGTLNSMDEGKIADLRAKAKQLKEAGYIPPSFPHDKAKPETLEKEIASGLAAKEKAEKKAEKKEPVS